MTTTEHFATEHTRENTNNNGSAAFVTHIKRCFFAKHCGIACRIVTLSTALVAG